MSIQIAAGVVLAIFALGAAHPPSTSAGVLQSFSTEKVKWKNGGVALVGTLYLPKGTGPFPAAVFLHGSGGLTREDRTYSEHGERLARLGLALLVYDKRGTGQSSGDWKTVGFRELADDALGGVAALRANKQIASDRIGLLGISQAGWVAADILERTPSIAFAALISAPPMTVEEQSYFITERAMRAKGFGDDEVKQALELQRQIYEVYRTDAGWEQAAAAQEKVRAKPWFETAEQAGVGLQPRDSWNWRWVAKLFGRDPVPAFRDSKAPMFVAYGEVDPIVPGPRSAQVMQKLAQDHGREITVLLVPGVAHDLGIRKGPQPGAYWSGLEAWLRDQKILAATK